MIIVRKQYIPSVIAHTLPGRSVQYLMSIRSFPEGCILIILFIPTYKYLLQYSILYYSIIVLQPTFPDRIHTFSQNRRQNIYFIFYYGGKGLISSIFLYFQSYKKKNDVYFNTILKEGQNNLGAQALLGGGGLSDQ